uniref:Glucose-methanol-choline oxidoreductase N-terminal domain-containing protein n=1 Tax=Clastoptera arizonana TaxID=38151 RepID=A0A1B6D9F6_9HEMI
MVTWVLKCLLLLASEAVAQRGYSYPPLTEYGLRWLSEGIRLGYSEPRDERNILREYDFIVVGAGSAGCVVASRLSEVTNWKVLLLEAGGAENFVMDIPILANMLQFSNINWKYKTVSQNDYCLGMKNHQCNVPRGKVMGGSSVLNYMIFTRGNRRDYDKWAEMGSEGWSYKEVLPYFMKSEDIEIEEMKSNTKYHNVGGYMTVTHPPFQSPLAKSFVEGSRELGYRRVDYNGATQTGFDFHQTSMKNGTRWSTSSAFLHPARSRRNLHVKKLSQVTKILINPKTKTAYGVEFIQNRRRYRVSAKREVILSAGAINSPQLLMLSGIGPEEHLQQVGIPVIKDLAVGFNLQDHVALGGLTFLVNDTVSSKTERILSSENVLYDFIKDHDSWITIPGGCEALGFIDLDNPTDPDGYPDLELLFISGTMASEPTLRENFGLRKDLYDYMFNPIANRDGFMIFPMVLRPKSMGRVKLKDANPIHPPTIDLGYFSDPEDLNVLVEGVKISIKLAKTKAFHKYNAQLYNRKIPRCRNFTFGSDDYWKCQAREFSYTIYHQVGTCKMGSVNDPTSVVDPRLRVHGIKGLRVIDASIMPKIPAAHTNAPVIMIGEKGSDMIKEDWGVPITT